MEKIGSRRGRLPNFKTGGQPKPPGRVAGSEMQRRIKDLRPRPREGKKTDRGPPASCARSPINAPVFLPVDIQMSFHTF